MQPSPMTLMTVALAAVSVLHRPSPAGAQGTLEAYRRAERFLPWNASRLMSGATLQANWIPGGDQFWYREVRASGKRFVLVDPPRRYQGPAFDHQRLAQALTARGVPATADGLPFDSLEAFEPGRTLQVRIANVAWSCGLGDYGCQRADVPPARSDREARSPDGRWIVFVSKHNISIRPTAGGEPTQLTSDGSSDRGYGTGVVSPRWTVLDGTAEGRVPVFVVWAPDSRRFMTYRVDERNAKRLVMSEAARPEHDLRPRSHSYSYPLPGDTLTAMASLEIFDVETRRRIIPEVPPVPVLYYGLYPTVREDHYWSADGRRLYKTHWNRGYQDVQLWAVEAETGRARMVIRETATTFVERFYQRAQWSEGPEAVLWASERDGWRHLYRYEHRTGTLQNQITRGPWVVREVLAIDWSAGTVLFTAGGREPDRDPYYRHLYRIRLDGTGLQLLTAEPADHQITLSPSGRFAVDTYGTIDTPQRTVLRSTTDGSILLELQRADWSLLLAAGWRPPQPFRVKARDGVTDAYGVLVFPTNFDSTKRYPILDHIYAGPQTLITPKTLTPDQGPYSTWQRQALAELGFVVMIVDGMGTPFRSRAWHDVAYRNLGDAGLEDHMSAVRQLAARHRYLDTTRVAIFGVSAGGYASARAILGYPDFYQVAVSEAGNHDHRLDKSEWVERYMGVEVGPHYREQANPTHAGRLKGKLFLVHGDIDDNVPVAQTYQLADALIKANKDFDLLILPNRLHDFNDDPYFVRRRWDFFVKHLLGLEPPPGYRIASPDPTPP
ncbi:MAG: DPP IV N-terminal domain-containing protein [Gemmatimonadales bacterium]